MATTTTTTTTTTAAAYVRPLLSARVRDVLSKIGVTLLGTFVLLVFLGPLGYMITTGLKNPEQISDPDSPRLWPASKATFEYQGEVYELYQVPTEDGIRHWALVDKGRESSTFIDPANPEAGLITWEGRWRTLKPVYELDPQWQNFVQAAQEIDPSFPILFRNTFIIAGLGTLGTVVSSTLVAYGFARFSFRGKNVLFLILIATIILPFQATLIPTYILFARIHWTGTFLPLIVPHFFANAYNVFLLRQYFMTIPRELDEAAMIDGASPFRVLTSVILPQSVPALTAVCLFHFFFAWNDFFAPLVYLSARRELWPISLGVQAFNALYARQPCLIQATALVTMILPVVVFFLAQRIFMQGIVFTGVER